MSYEKPKASAGLIIGGVIGTGAWYLLARAGWSEIEPNLAVVEWVLLPVSAGLLLVGLWRFFSAFDAIALHRWHATVAAEEEELRRLNAKDRPGS